MCYPNGGDEPTITDANLVLGRIPPALIGGGIALDAARARAGLAALAARLPGAHERRAAGARHHRDRQLEPGATRIRQMTIQRGIDPRDFALLSFGGAGPAQSPAVMDLLGMKACIVPPNPGNLSAFGLLAVDWRTDHIVTKVMHEDAIDLATVATLYAQLEAEALETLRRDGIDAARIRLVREADVRYAGQSMEVRVTAPGGTIDAAFLARLIDAFHAAHLKTFGYNYAGQQKVELVNFCVSGFGVIERPSIPRLAPGGHAKPARRSTRPVYFDGAFRDTPIYDRAVLAAGRSPRGAGRDRGVRLHYRGLPRAMSRSRPARHPRDRAHTGSGGMNIQRMSSGPRPDPHDRAASIRSCCRSSKAR